MKKSEIPITIHVVPAPVGTPMYQVPVAIVNDMNNVSPSAFMLYVLLWNENPTSIIEMAKMLSCSVSTVNRGIACLKKNGYLQSTGRGRNCTYTIIEK